MSGDPTPMPLKAIQDPLDHVVGRAPPHLTHFPKSAQRPKNFFFFQIKDLRI